MNLNKRRKSLHFIVFTALKRLCIFIMSPSPMRQCVKKDKSPSNCRVGIENYFINSLLEYVLKTGECLGLELLSNIRFCIQQPDIQWTSPLSSHMNIWTRWTLMLTVRIWVHSQKSTACCWGYSMWFCHSTNMNLCWRTVFLLTISVWIGLPTFVWL